jgi:methyl-transferase
MKKQEESQAQMICLRDWFWHDRRGQALLQQETEVIKRSLIRIAPNDFQLMQIGPIDLFSDMQLSHTFQLHVSLIPPCEVMASLEQLPLSKESIDVLLCHHSLEGVDDKDLALQDISRVLRPEGYAIFCLFNPKVWWYSRPKWQGHAIFRRKDGINVQQLVSHLKEHQLKVVEGRFTFYLPLLNQHLGLHQAKLLEQLGHRWWPDLANVYILTAKKQVAELITIEGKERAFDLRRLNYAPFAREKR